MNKVFGQIHDAISKVLYKNDMDIEAPSFYDLVTTITDDQQLWNDYQAALRKNNVVTSFACTEYLMVFIEENRECIEEQHFISKSSKNNSNAFFTVKKQKSEYFGNARSVCDMILKSCKDEITNNVDQNQWVTSRRQGPCKIPSKRRIITEKKEKSMLRDSLMYSKTNINRNLTRVVSTILDR